MLQYTIKAFKQFVKFNDINNKIKDFKIRDI